MKLLITGGTGYIGSRLATLAFQQGHEVIVASRRQPLAEGSWMPFDLAYAGNLVLPDGVDAVVHLAAQTGPDAENPGVDEIEAAKGLSRATSEAGVRLIFISSQTARVDAPTRYGRTKWAVEQVVSANGGWSVRPGQVYGGAEEGLFGTLVLLVRRLPLLPAFTPAPLVQPIHVDDLSGAILRIAEGRTVPGVIRLADPNPISFTEFLKVIARTHVHRKRFFLPVPAASVSVAARLMGRRISRRLGLERLKSLFGLPLMDTAVDLKLLGLTLRSLSDGMRPGQEGDKPLIVEGRALLRYVTKERPSRELVERYARAVEKMRHGRPLVLPDWAVRHPIFIALLDSSAGSPPANPDDELAWRIHAASSLAEATPQGARRFWGLGKSGGFVRSLAIIFLALISEAAWRVISGAAGPFLRRTRRALSESE